MTDLERKVLFEALRGPVDSVRDPLVVQQLEDLAAGQLREIEEAVETLLHARLVEGFRIGVEGCTELHLAMLRAYATPDLQTCATPPGNVLEFSALRHGHGRGGL